jgi:TetR/AcrR family acrAB operon transcriptional repressor
MPVLVVGPEMTMARQTKEKALETRERILDAAEIVFHSRGVARTSLAHIAETAGVTRGAIYFHFDNKSEVFAAMCERVRLPVDVLREPEHMAHVDDALEGIRNFCTHVMRQTAVNPKLRRVLEVIFHKCEMVPENGAIVERQRQSRERGGAKIRAHLCLAIERGQLPEDLDLELAVNAFQATISGVLAHWLFAPESFDLDIHAECVTDALIDTLRLSPALRKGYVSRQLSRGSDDVGHA